MLVTKCSKDYIVELKSLLKYLVDYKKVSKQKILNELVQLGLTFAAYISLYF